MTGIGGEQAYYKIARAFLEGRMEANEAKSELVPDVKYIGNARILPQLFDALVQNLDDNLTSAHTSAMERKPLELFIEFLHMLAYGVTEADSLLGGTKLFRKGGGNRSIPKSPVSRLAQISALAEAPILLMLPFNSPGPRTDLGTRQPAPWYEYTGIFNFSEVNHRKSVVFCHGRIILEDFAIAVGLCYVRLREFNQLSITMADGMARWTLPWKDILITLASAHCKLALPAVLTISHEFFTSTGIYRLSWASVGGVTDVNEFLVRIYTRIFSPRTTSVRLIGADRSVVTEVMYPLYNRQQVIYGIHQSGLVHKRTRTGK